MQFKKFVVIISVVLLLGVLSFPYILIRLTYKTEYLNIIQSNLASTELNSSELNENFVLSVIKTESSFNTNAKSNADAFGLMQLQFSTAKEVATKLNLNLQIEDLFNPNINIKIGINYLNYLFSVFNEKHLVIISYNAGLNRVKQWINNNEIFIENGIYITPFEETTNYLKRVLQNEKIYKKIRG